MLVKTGCYFSYAGILPVGKWMQRSELTDPLRIPVLQRLENNHIYTHGKNPVNCSMGLSIIKVNPQSFCPCSEDMIETAQKVAKADSNMEISIYIYEHMAAYMDVKAAQT